MSSKRNAFSIRLFGGILVLIGLSAVNSLAQESFPAKPITMVIRSGAGGMADTMTRALSKVAEKELGQPIVCENRPGGGGVVGVSYVLKSKPDGYTLGATTTASYINSPHMEKVPYDPVTGVTDIIVFFKYTHGLVVKTDSPWNTFQDVIAYAKENPVKFSMGIAGMGVTEHIVMERIAKKEGIKFSFVPFKSGAEVLVSTLGGHVSSGGLGPADCVQQINAGQMKLILALNDIRWPIAPNVPTVLENYGFYGLSLQGIYGPKGMPEHVREKLHNTFKKAMSDPSYLETAKTLNVVVTYMSGKDYEKLWKSHYDEMGKIIRDLGLGKK